MRLRGLVSLSTSNSPTRRQARRSFPTKLKDTIRTYSLLMRLEASRNELLVLTPSCLCPMFAISVASSVPTPESCRAEMHQRHSDEDGRTLQDLPLFPDGQGRMMEISSDEHFLLRRTDEVLSLAFANFADHGIMASSYDKNQNFNAKFILSLVCARRLPYGTCAGHVLIEHPYTALVLLHVCNPASKIRRKPASRRAGIK